MRTPTFFAISLCSLALAQAAEPLPSPGLPHPLNGVWSWTLAGKQCAESLQYRANGAGTSTSGVEHTQSHYEVSPMPSLLGFYRIAETVTESNGQPDCSGDMHEVTNAPAVRFIQFSPRHDLLIVCKTEALKECFGPLKRMTP